LKICLIGDFSDSNDEGLKNIAHYLAGELSKSQELMLLNVKNLSNIFNFFAINKFRPQIIHYIPGPTEKSFVFLKLLGLLINAKTIMSAPQPRINPLFYKFIYLFKPDMILLQSSTYKSLFDSLKVPNRLIINGVDIERYKPSSTEQKITLRTKYKINLDKYIILHVGHMMERRNLRILEDMIDENNCILVVVSEYLEFDDQLHEELIKKGFIVIKGFCRQLEEIYQLSDCYIFPVRKENTLLTPLSVMEAMACNLPVITTSFEGLTENFAEGNGLLFFENEKDLISKFNALKKNDIIIKNRDKVLPYSWSAISKKIIEFYEELLIDG
jgi:glycosyltransferase involved in cell wall biosynthesis